MGQEQPSEIRPYRSRYGGGFLTAQQFLAEGMCARLARNKKFDLPDRFWNLPTWKRTFLAQLRFANGLVKLYDPKAIVAALKRCPGAYSLGAKWLDPYFQEEQLRLNRKAATPPPEPTVVAPATDITRREAFAAKPTQRSLLERYE